MENTTLFPVLPTDFCKLMTVLKNRIPTSALLCNILHLEMKQRYSTNTQVTFYMTNGQLQDENCNDTLIIVAVATTKSMKDDVILFSIPNNSTKYTELLQILDSFINWSLPHTFGEVPENLAPKLVELYRSKAGTGHHVHDEAVRFYTMDIQDALNLELKIPRRFDNSIKIKPLSPEEDSNIVNIKWLGCREGTFDLVKDSIETIGSIGIYNLDNNNELISWAIISTLSSINALHTKENWRGSGLGELTFKSIVQIASQNGLIPIAHVHHTNEASQNLMIKVGLKYTHNVLWLLFNEIIPNN